MLNKELKFSEDARQNLLKGINVLANAVKVTYGPRGKYVIINNNDEPKITKDGVSVAKEIKLDDPFKDMGAQLIKEAAIKTLNTVGDATTTSTILAQAIVNECNIAIHNNISPLLLKKGIEYAKNKVLSYIDKHTISVTDKDVINIATISANNDIELGKLIGETFNKIGKDGIITVEESNTEKTEVNIVNGMQFDKGYVSQHFVTNYIKDNCVLENCYILITEHKINSIRDIAHILSAVIESGKSILLIAEDYSSEVLETLKLNKLNGTIKICAIKAPSFGEYRNKILEDIAIFTNGENISYESSLELVDSNVSMLGKASKVIVTKDSTIIMCNNDNKDAIATRVTSIKEENERLKTDASKDNSFVFDFNKQRIARLTGGISVIYVGGITDLERSEKKDRVEDAVFATKAAIDEGVVLGGGLTYYNAISSIPNKIEYKDGINIIKSALSVPISLLIESAGKSLNDIKNGLSYTKGFDAITGTCVNMYKHGIIDPAKASKLALENAISIGELFLSSECIIAPKMAENRLII